MDRFLRNNTVLRIIALILACILWLAVSAPSNSQANSAQQEGIPERFPFAIHVQLGDSITVVSQSAQTATVTVKSDLWNLASLSAEMQDVQVVANAVDLGPGKYTLPLTALNMQNITGGSSTISPATVTVVIERKSEITEPVKVTVNGSPAAGQSVGNTTLSNSSVQVSGLKSAVSQVAAVVGTVSIAGATGSVTKVVSLTAVGQDGTAISGVQLNPTSITATVPILSVADNVNLVPQITGQPAQGYAVSGVQMSALSAKVFGLDKSKLPIPGVSVPIDVSGLQQSTTLQVHVPVSPGVTKISPASITANVSIEPSISRVFSNLPIQVINLSGSMNVTVPTSQAVTIRVTGPASVVQGMTAQNVTVYIDARQLKAGDTTASLGVQVPNWVDVTQMSMAQVPIQVS